jgi:hypothetical protein
MKATLSFNLDEHFDRCAHARAVNSTEAYLALLSLKDFIREHTKHGPSTIDAESLSNKFFEIIEAYGINFDHLP